MHFTDPGIEREREKNSKWVARILSHSEREKDKDQEQVYIYYIRCFEKMLLSMLLYVLSKPKVLSFLMTE